MKIGIIGSGNIGATVGALLAKARHEVFYSFSRSDEKLRNLAAAAGDESRWGTARQAVEFGDVILLAPPYRELDAVLEAAGPMTGKIVMDAVNPYTSTGPAYRDSGTAAEEIAAKLLNARIVKTYNHIYFKHIAERNHENPPLVAFISGDDAQAKQIAGQLLSDTGFFVWDLGDLYTARWTEPHGPLFNQPMTEAEAKPIVEKLPAIKRA
ncbi:MAG: NAD(P)-binding domain-containing protein [Blastochloris sp.]|nr:NAD(P)-binding domain-containing protein [Blastochloris sp.]